MMVSLLLIFLFTGVMQTACAQGFLELNYGLVDIGKSEYMKGAQTAVYSGSLLYQFGNSTAYGGVTLSHIRVNDKIETTNRYVGNLLGAKLGFRPFSKVWFTRWQPVIEGKWLFSLPNKDDKATPLKMNYGGAAGLEYFFSPKSSLGATLSREVYSFSSKNTLSFFSANFYLRIGF